MINYLNCTESNNLRLFINGRLPRKKLIKKCQIYLADAATVILLVCYMTLRGNIYFYSVSRNRGKTLELIVLKINNDIHNWFLLLYYMYKKVQFRIFFVQ